MNVVFDQSFLKSLDKLKSGQLKRKIETIILKLESASSLSEISGVKKLQGFKRITGSVLGIIV